MAAPFGWPGAARAEGKRPRLVVVSIKPVDEEARRPAAILTEVILTDLSRLDRVEVLGETEIASMVGFEQQRELLGCTEGNCLAQIGGALGCEYLLMGSLGRVGSRLRLDLKIADLRKASIVARDGALVESSDDLVSAARKSLRALVAALPAAKAPASPALPSGASQASRRSGRGPLPWALVAGGGALTIGGGALAAVAVANKRHLTFDQAQSRSTAGLWIAGAGVAAAAVGVIVLVSGSSAAVPHAALAWMPTPGGGGLVAVGRF